jgi:hypothetical protein
MTRIGFPIQQHVESLAEKRTFAAWTEPKPNLPLAARQRLLEIGLGTPPPPILRCGSAQEYEDDFVLEREFRPFGNLAKVELLRFRRDGALILQRGFDMDGTKKGWFHGDDWLVEFAGDCLRGANLASLMPQAQFLHISGCVQGVKGASLIHNPRRETFRTVCSAAGPIGREEFLEVGSRETFETSLARAAYMIANDVFNKFRPAGSVRLPRGCLPYAYVTQQEVAQALLTTRERLRFEAGALRN